MGYQYGKLVIRPVSNFLFGALGAIGSAYIASRMKEKQEAESRMERLEQIVDRILIEEAEKSGKK